MGLHSKRFWEGLGFQGSVAFMELQTTETCLGPPVVSLVAPLPVAELRTFKCYIFRPKSTVYRD